MWARATVYGDMTQMQTGSWKSASSTVEDAASTTCADTGATETCTWFYEAQGIGAASTTAWRTCTALTSQADTATWVTWTQEHELTHAATRMWAHVASTDMRQGTDAMLEPSWSVIRAMILGSTVPWRPSDSRSRQRRWRHDATSTGCMADGTLVRGALTGGVPPLHQISAMVAVVGPTPSPSCIPSSRMPVVDGPCSPRPTTLSGPW
jgi:hypothetical protein